ncbi:uncharacterized protein LOC131957629 [Physella acuta]|uniref:uncharacterized protein LOC131957629 n=1 Tax=Physella acuta TaxID=109671 RepID=UPI0027DCBA13|nr:uncharacterized protein LOC131957629 [Physella acuta]
MSDHLKKHLMTQLQLLDQASFHLQGSISDFVQQIKMKAMESKDHISDCNTTVIDAITMVTSAQNTLLEQADRLAESTKLYPLTVMTREKATPEVACYTEAIRRQDGDKHSLLSLQDTKQKTEDDISDTKQWRNNFVAEQKDNRIKIEKLCIKQKQNFTTQKEQLKEQDNKIEELNQQIKSLKTKESDTDKTLEKLSLDMKEYENNPHTLKKEMGEFRDQTQGIQGFSETFVYQIACLEKDILKLTRDLQTIANQQLKNTMPGFIASHGSWDGTCQHMTIYTVERNVGNYFDPTTGEFTAPADGLYIASLTIKQTGDDVVRVDVYHKSDGVESRVGVVKTQDDSKEESRTMFVRMKAGDLLYLESAYVDYEFNNYSCFFLGE